VLYPKEEDESTGNESETREAKLLESPRSTSSSPKQISAAGDGSVKVAGRCGVGNEVEHPAVFRPQYGESSEPPSSTSSEVVPSSFFLGVSGIRNDPPRKNWVVRVGEGSGDAKGEGRGVSWGDFGTFGNRASLSASFPPPCTEVLRGTSRIFPSSTQKSQGQSLSLPLAVGRHELAVLSPEMEVPDCA
jgi:hypothetical protein